MGHFKNELDYINKLIEVAKKNLSKYPVSEELITSNSFLKWGDVDYVCNRYYTEELYILEKIKNKLEAFDVVKEELQIVDKTTNLYNEPLYRYELNVIGQDNIDTLYRGLEVNQDGHIEMD